MVAFSNSGLADRLASLLRQLPTSLWLILFGLLLSLGVSTRTAGLTATILCIQMLIGHRVLILALPGIRTGSLSLIGPGFILGAILWVFPVQLLGSGFRLNLIWLLLLLSVSAWKKPAVTPLVGSHEVVTLLTIIGLTFLFLSGEWPQFVFVGAIALVLGVGPSRAMSLNWGVVALGAVLLCTFGTVRIFSNFAGSYWWIVTDDYSYHEAMRVHLANFGIWTEWGTTDVALYHWFTNAWIGQTAQLTLAEPWVTLTRVSPVAFGSSLTASLLLLGVTRLNLTSGIPRRSVVVCSTFIILALRVDLTSPSTYAVLAIIATGLLALEICTHLENQRSRGGLTLLPLIFISAVLTKFTAITSVLVLAPPALASLFSSTRRHRYFLPSLRLAAISTALAFLVFAGPVLSRGWTFGLVGGIEGPMRSTVNLSTTYLLTTCIVALVGRWLISAEKWRGVKNFSLGEFPIVESAFLSAVSLVLLIPGSAVDIRNFFALPLLLISGVYLFGSPTSSTIGFISRPTYLVAVGSFCLVLGVRSVSAMVPDADDRNVFAGVYNFPWLLLGLSVLGLGFGLNALQAVRLRRPVVHLSLALALGGILFATSSTIERLDDTNSGDFSRSTSRVTSIIGDPLLIEVGYWLKENTAPSELFATDLLCGSEGRALNASSLRLWCAESSVDMTLAHTSQRKFFILAPRFSYQNAAVTEERVSLSLQFANSRSAEDARQLVSRGNTHFVLDNRLGQADSVSGSAGVVFQNDRYLILDLQMRSRS